MSDYYTLLCAVQPDLVKEWNELRTWSVYYAVATCRICVGLRGGKFVIESLESRNRLLDIFRKQRQTKTYDLRFALHSDIELRFCVSEAFWWNFKLTFWTLSQNSHYVPKNSLICCTKYSSVTRKRTDLHFITVYFEKWYSTLLYCCYINPSRNFYICPTERDLLTNLSNIYR